MLFRDRAGRPDDDTLRRALRKALNKCDNARELSRSERGALEWAEKASQPISTLNNSDVVMGLLGALATRLDGTPAAPDYYSRRRRSMRTLCSYAVRKKRLATNPLASNNLPADWSPPKGDDRVDPRSIGGAELVGRMLESCHLVGPRQGPRFAAFFGCMFWAMMRPAEGGPADTRRVSASRIRMGELTFASSARPPVRPTPPTAKSTRIDSPRTDPRKPSAPCRSRRSLWRCSVGTSTPSASRRMAGSSGARAATASSRRRTGGVWQRVREVALTPEQVLSPLMKRPYDLAHAGITWRLNVGVRSPRLPNGRVTAWR